MPVINSIADIASQAKEWRRDMHKNPQTAYEETFANDLIKQKLSAWGISFKDGYAGTGIVATIHGQDTSSGKTIGLRADIDALDILEKSGVDHSSQIPGKMHACGHDGHTAILLAAAQYLSETRNFNGTVNLYFQPAEETAKGSTRMIEAGCLDDFPCDHIFALHNWPHLPVGKVAIHEGPAFAAVDEFNITINAKGGHGADPNLAIDPVIVATQMIQALQTIVSRNLDPLRTGVLSVTSLNIGTGSMNVIEENGYLTGTVRTFNNQDRDMIEKRIHETCENIAASLGASVNIHFIRHIGATINSDDGFKMSYKAMQSILDDENILTDHPKSTGGEDFATFLTKVSGSCILIGQADPDVKNSACNQPLHSPHYDFNDDVIPIGASYFARLVENYMPK